VLTAIKENGQMNRDTSDVYDPGPTDMQLRALDSIGQEDLDLSDMSDPRVVKLLVLFWKGALTQVKTNELRVARLQGESMELRQDREDLRIEIARLQERVKASWLEIPISVGTGFAINMLTSNPSDQVGLVLLIISLVMLALLHGTDIVALAGRLRSTWKGNDNA